MRLTTLSIAVALMAASLVTTGQALAQQAATEPQGLYSADTILDADAYLANDPNTAIGEIEDILLDDAMQVQAVVVESGATLGLGGRDIVIDNEHYRLESITQDGGDVEHRVIVDASKSELEKMPKYDAGWWEEARQRAREAWEATREGAESAWQQTREGAQRAADTIDEKIGGDN
ncbi:PRC-barrel domain-containing protein [Litchfieldella rifensis]|uniref:PRC-barrel domain-containing protein n=1 Tax=Litchfieldella rifensis TaxID=762643 RepID=A0ABV7LRG0_9GAMM